MQRHIHLWLDEADWNTIQNELAFRQGQDRSTVGESNLAGAHLAEMIRDLEEYRQMFASKDSQRT